MRLRIVSDGTARGTRVIIPETGEEIGVLVSAVTWSLDAEEDRVAHVTLRLSGLSVDLDGEGEVPA